MGMTPTLLSAIARALKKPVETLYPEDLRQVRELDLNHTELSDLKPLGALTGLQSLNLSFGKQITDAGLAHLSALTGLQSLNLDRTKITDAGLAHLSGCTKLIILERDDTKVTEAGKKRFFDAIKRK